MLTCSTHGGFESRRGLVLERVIPTDLKERYKFAKKYMVKKPEWWEMAVDIYLDNHAFKVALRQPGRKLAAKRRVRGVYRKKGT